VVRTSGFVNAQLLPNSKILLLYTLLNLFGAWYEALRHTKYTSAYLPNLSNTLLGGAQVMGSVWRPVGPPRHVPI